jgi:hypothetical protein
MLELQSPDFTEKRASIPVDDLEYNDISPQTKLLEDIVKRVKSIKPGRADSAIA